MRSILATMFLSLAVFAMQSSPAAAHRLKVFATVVGADVQGRAYFVGGGAAGGVPATLRDAGGAVLAGGQTDADGRFVLAAPVRAELTVVVDSGDGHIARFAIAASRLPETLPAGAAVATEPVQGSKGTAAAPQGDMQAVAGADAIAAAMARQIEPLAEQLDALESSIRLRDVLGGLGYIAGIFGLAAFLKARCRRADKAAR